MCLRERERVGEEGGNPAAFLSLPTDAVTERARSGSLTRLSMDQNTPGNPGLHSDFHCERSISIAIRDSSMPGDRPSIWPLLRPVHKAGYATAKQTNGDFLAGAIVRTTEQYVGGTNRTQNREHVCK